VPAKILQWRLFLHRMVNQLETKRDGIFPADRGGRSAVEAPGHIDARSVSPVRPLEGYVVTVDGDVVHGTGRRRQFAAARVFQSESKRHAARIAEDCRNLDR